MNHSHVNDFTLAFSCLIVDICTIQERNKFQYKRWACFSDNKNNRFSVTWEYYFEISSLHNSVLFKLVVWEKKDIKTDSCF